MPIAFGSQRASGGDMARHLLNAEDNEYVDVMEVRGSIADDLAGAFAEWEVHALTMTRCKKYLYSLSVNPDTAQGPLTHDQYMDYIERTEAKLGLQGQPRAIVAHIKENKLGELREHYHCVWSRIDVAECRAIPISFDRMKLMAVSREFAHDHGLTLPDGYRSGKAKAKQLSLYDKVQMDQTGLSKKDRMDLITDLWRASDSAKAFVAGLEENGYMLARGRRPYVLVDIYGHTNALPRMIDDKQVRQQDVAAFLETEFPSEELPDVDEAKKLAASHYQERKALLRVEEQAEQLEVLKRSQDSRTEKLSAEIEDTLTRHARQRADLDSAQAEARDALALRQAGEDVQVQFERAQNAPKGLLGFFSRISGIDFVRGRLHARDDNMRENKHALERDGQAQRQHEQAQQLKQTQQLQMMELRRKERAQESAFNYERRTLSRKHEMQRAIEYRRGAEHMPALHLNLAPGGRKAVPHKAARRYTSPTVKELNVKARPRDAGDEHMDVRRDFTHAAKAPQKSATGSSRSQSTDFVIPPQQRDRGKKR